MKLLLSSLLLAMVFQSGPITTKGSESFRILPIPKRENGYSNFASIAFTSKEDFDAFMRRTSTQIGWNDRKGFEDVLRDAKVDFTQEALLLLRHTEPSGSVQVTFERPTLQDMKLVCEIRGKPLRSGGSADMAYYCLAVVISKSAVNEVELQAVEGGFYERHLAPIVFPIVPKAPSNKSLDRTWASAE